MTVSVTKKALNVREKLAELDKPTGIAGEAMLRAETPQEQFNLIGAGRRNWIINGSHIVNQRGVLPVTGTTHNTYQLTDRWRTMLSGVTGNAELVTTNQPDVNVSGKSVKLTATSSATGFIGAYQVVEDHSVFAGKQVTVSAWMKTTVSSGFRIYDGTNQHYGEKVNTNGQWVFTTFTTTLPESISTLQLYFDQYTGPGASIVSGNYAEFTLVQLELGKVATPFEQRSYGEELALCQRYYYREDTSSHFLRSFYAASTGDLYEDYPLPVVMRATPTWTSQLGSDVSKVNAVSISGRTKKSGYVIFTISSTGEGYCSLNTVTADAEL